MGGSPFGIQGAETTAGRNRRILWASAHDWAVPPSALAGRS